MICPHTDIFRFKGAGVFRVTNRLVPYHKGNLGNDDLVTTAMWDITKSGHEINWNGAFGAGLEHELLSLNYLHILPIMRKI